MLRIITGTAKNKHLLVPESARPMMDRAKSAIFSMIQTRIPNSMVLDLYAGSGAMGLECLSRGAKFCRFVEITEEGSSCIEQNAINCKFTKDEFKIEKTDVLNYLAKILHKKYRAEAKENDGIVELDEIKDAGKFDDIQKSIVVMDYDIIFVCPPHISVTNEALRLASRILKKDGILIAECPQDKELLSEIGDLYLEEKRNYGKTDIYFYLTKDS